MVIDELTFRLLFILLIINVGSTLATYDAPGFIRDIDTIFEITNQTPNIWLPVYLLHQSYPSGPRQDFPIYSFVHQLVASVVTPNKTDLEADAVIETALGTVIQPSVKKTTQIIAEQHLWHLFVFQNIIEGNLIVTTNDGKTPAIFIEVYGSSIANRYLVTTTSEQPQTTSEAYFQTTVVAKRVYPMNMPNENNNFWKQTYPATMEPPRPYFNSMRSTAPTWNRPGRPPIDSGLPPPPVNNFNNNPGPMFPSVPPGGLPELLPPRLQQPNGGNEISQYEPYSALSPPPIQQPPQQPQVVVPPWWQATTMRSERTQAKLHLFWLAISVAILALGTLTLCVTLLIIFYCCTNRISDLRWNPGAGLSNRSLGCLFSFLFIAALVLAIVGVGVVFIHASDGSIDGFWWTPTRLTVSVTVTALLVIMAIAYAICQLVNNKFFLSQQNSGQIKEAWK